MHKNRNRGLMYVGALIISLSVPNAHALLVFPRFTIQA